MSSSLASTDLHLWRFVTNHLTRVICISLDHHLCIGQSVWGIVSVLLITIYMQTCKFRSNCKRIGPDTWKPLASSIESLTFIRVWGIVSAFCDVVCLNALFAESRLVSVLIWTCWIGDIWVIYCGLYPHTLGMHGSLISDGRLVMLCTERIYCRWLDSIALHCNE